MENIDNFAYLVLLLLLFCAVFASSDMMGGLSLVFSFLVIFKMIFACKKEKYFLEIHEKIFIFYFLFVTISLMGSSLFALSLHGYIKTLIYVLFFFAASYFFNSNKNKIMPTIFFVVVLTSFESVIAILQNIRGVEEISGWQDMSNINPEQIISRAYGTLKPYNPNLLAGYLLCGLSSYIVLILSNLKNGKKRYALIYSAFFLLNLIAIIDTGCRGAYLGFLFFFPVLFLALFFHLKKTFGSISNIKKRYKNLFIVFSAGLFAFIATNPAIIKRIQSIFALRADSSISFRLNVYEAVWKMFLDNPFLGIGIGNQNFREIYGLYMKTGYDALGSYCVPLEIAVESGVFALFAFILFLIFIVKKCVLICSNNKNLAEKIIALSIVLLICATMGHGLFDTIWFRPQLQFLFWTNLAFLKALKV